ncbi:MAG: hypothetical protein IKT87_08370 [Bacteroidaceae bacterium]|nr:hypothetical protein [Bacteroidaceae bacterium]
MIEMKQPFDIDQYLIEIGREELLTLEQEQELAELIRQGDNSAAISLARANLRFVVALVRQYTDKGVSVEELIATGNKALEQAAVRYAQEASSEPFIKYAVPLVREALEVAIS